MPYAFPGDVALEFTSWISKAVHCQAQYNSYPVLKEINNVCTVLNTAQLKAKIQEVHIANTAMVKKH